MYQRISSTKLKEIRKHLLEEQEYNCAVTKQNLSFEGSVVDHKHRNKKSDPINEKSGGLIRGVIDRYVNAFIGKIENNFKRYGLHNKYDLPTLLRQIADYIENPPAYKHKLIHPSEKLPEKTLGKREFNKFKKFLIKKYPKRKSLEKLDYFKKIPKKYQEDYQEFTENL